MLCFDYRMKSLTGRLPAPRTDTKSRVFGGSEHAFRALPLTLKSLPPRTEMRLTIIGCGDAFGSGGRLQTALHLSAGASRTLIDCGASTLIGMHRLGLKPSEIDAGFISHLPGDHFGGLSWLLIDVPLV